MKLALLRQIALPLLAAAALLAGCAAPTPGPVPTLAATGVTATLEIATSEAATARAGATATALALQPASPTVPVRSAELHELVNVVEARPDDAATFATASEGQAVGEAGEVRTGDASKAKLDFSDGAIVRLAPNTLFVVEGLAGTNDNPLTQLQFALGKIWVSLFSGQFDAETPVGVATVRGSYAEFQYNPGADPNSTADDVLTIKCIEGICTYSDGSRTITLGNLQQLIVRDNGRTITGPTPLPAAAVDEFLANSPESTAVVLTLTAAAPSPTITRTPSRTPVPSDTPVPPTPTRTRIPPTITPSATSTPSATLPPTDTATNPPPPPPPADTNTPVPSDTPIPPDTDTPTPNYTPTRTPGPTKTPSPTNTP